MEYLSNKIQHAFASIEVDRKECEQLLKKALCLINKGEFSFDNFTNKPKIRNDKDEVIWIKELKGEVYIRTKSCHTFTPNNLGIEDILHLANTIFVYTDNYKRINFYNKCNDLGLDDNIFLKLCDYFGI